MLNQVNIAFRVAETQKGVKEISGSKHNPKIVEYAQSCTLQAQDDETPWCAEFVNWCMIIAAILLNPASALALLKKYKYEQKDIDLFFKSAAELAPTLGFDSQKILAFTDTQFPVVLGTRSALARSWLLFGVEAKNAVAKFVIGIYSRGNNGVSGHVNFPSKFGTLSLEGLGGNQSNTVNVTTYLKGRALGYRTLPSYDIRPSTLIGA